MDKAICDKIPESFAFGNHFNKIPFFMVIIYNFVKTAKIDNEDNQPAM